MKVRSKKLLNKGVARLETSGEIKEIIVKEDFLNPKEAVFEVCFRGDKSSGIIEFTSKEMKEIQKELLSKKKLLGTVKVMKFKK